MNRRRRRMSVRANTVNPLLRWPLATVSLGAAIAVLPIFLIGVPTDGHDTWFLIQNLHSFSSQFLGGELYPKWRFDGNNGWGAPTFYVYPPLAYYAGTLFVWIGKGWFGIDRAAAIAIGCSFILSAQTCFIWLRRHVSTTVAVGAALLYVVAPYHLAADLLIRDAYSELWTFPVYPLLLIAIEDREASPWRFVAQASVPLSLLFMTNMPSATISILVFSAFALARRGLTPRFVAMWTCTGLLAVALAAFYVLPALALKDLVNTDRLMNDPSWSNYRTWYLDSGEFIDRLPGLFRVIVAEIAVIAGLVGWTWLRHRGRLLSEASRWPVAMSIALVVGLYLATSLSRPLLLMMPALTHVQFPWRVFAPLTVFAVGLIASLAAESSRAHLPKAVLTVLVVAWIYPAFRIIRHTTFGLGPAQVADILRSPDDAMWVPRRWSDPLNETGQIVAVPPNEPRVVEGEATATMRREGTAIIVHTIGSSNAVIVVPQLFFPSWKATVDGRDVPVRACGGKGELAVAVPSGEMSVVLSHRRLPVEIVGLLLSIAGAVAAVGLWRYPAVTRPELRGTVNPIERVN